MSKIGSIPVKSMVSESISFYLPFLWLGRLKFYVGKSVKFSLDRVSVSKIESVSPTERNLIFYIILYTTNVYLLVMI